jgi:hypothetical protein
MTIEKNHEQFHTRYAGSRRNVKLLAEIRNIMRKKFVIFKTYGNISDDNSKKKKN